MKIWDVTKDDESQYLQYVSHSEYSSVSDIAWNKNDQIITWVTSLGKILSLFIKFYLGTSNC